MNLTAVKPLKPVSFSKFHSYQPFHLESGSFLPDLTLAFHTYGTLNENKDNVIWVCHALTANSDVSDWWSSIFGTDKILNPNDYFIVCANNLGSCYGSSSAVSINPSTGKKYGKNFPLITIRDMVNAHRLLKNYLGIEKIKLLIGGSQGGQQCMEWAIAEPENIEKMLLLATNAKHSPWGIAFNEAQRMALKAGKNGLEAARAIAMLSYRNYEMYERTEKDQDETKLEDFGASEYQQYQGYKLANRFDADCYFTLSKAMDSHNVGRGKYSIQSALGQIKAKTLVIGISSDLLFPVHEQEFLAKYIPNAELEIIDSPYGHDGFLTEGKKINDLVLSFFKEVVQNNFLLKINKLRF